jgi:alpha-glucosidase
MNMANEPLELPAGEVLLRSSSADHELGDGWDGISSGETVWLRISAEDSES